MSDLRRRGGRAKERSEGAFGGAEKKRRGDRAAAIKYNYFPIEWKLFGNERRVIGDIHTFIKRLSLSLSSLSLSPFSLLRVPSLFRRPSSTGTPFFPFLSSFFFFFFFSLFFLFLLQRRSEMYSRHSRQIKPSATILFHCPSGRGGGRDSVANRRECNYPGLSSVCRDANNNDMSTGVIA